MNNHHTYSDESNVIHRTKEEIGVGVAMFCLDETGKKFIMLCRNMSGEWNLPGGKMEYGESMNNAVEREVFEEIGVRAWDTKFLFAHDSIYSEEGIHRIKEHWVTLYFIGKIYEKPEIKEHDKVIDMRLWGIEDLIKSRSLCFAPLRVALGTPLGYIRNQGDSLMNRLVDAIGITSEQLHEIDVPFSLDEVD